MEPVDINFQDVFRPNTHQRISTEITIGTMPPTEINVSSNGVAIDKGSLGITLDGTTSLRWGGRKLVVDARGEDRESQLLINQKGRVVYVARSEQIGNQQVDLFINEMSDGTRTRGRMHIDYIERFANLDIRMPETFEGYTLREITRFFFEEYDLTRAEFAENAGLSSTTSVDYILSGRHGVKSLATITAGLGLKGDEPSYEITRNAYRKTRERRSEVSRENALKRYR